MPNWTDRPHTPTIHRPYISAVALIVVMLVFAVLAGCAVAISWPATEVVRHAAPRWTLQKDEWKCLSHAGSVTRQWPVEVCQ